MSKLLLNMRNVPDDEADEVRAMLDAARIGYYETQPSRWGILFGGIWVDDERDVARAKQLLAEYPVGSRERDRAERAEAVREGNAETFDDSDPPDPLCLLLRDLGHIGRPPPMG